MDAQIATVIVALLINVPTWIMLRANSRKAGSDAYASLSEALNKSGKTIEDLFNIIAEVPQLKVELSAMRAELFETNRGAWANRDMLADHHLPIPYTPKKRYKTGELKKEATV